MQSTAKNVVAYLDQVPADRKATLTKLRKLCCSLLNGVEESMMYGGPCYSRNAEAEVAFASQTHFIARYMHRLEVMNAHRQLLSVKGGSLGKGIRYSKPEKIDFKVVEMLLKAPQKSMGAICADNAV